VPESIGQQHKVKIPALMGTYPATKDVPKDKAIQSPPEPRTMAAALKSTTSSMSPPSNKIMDLVVTAFDVVNSSHLYIFRKAPSPELHPLREEDIQHWIEEYEAAIDYEFLSCPDFPMGVLNLQLAALKIELKKLQIMR